MKAHSLTLDDALKLVKSSRSIICPNAGFYKQLEIWEEVQYELNMDNPHYRRFLVSCMAGTGTLELHQAYFK
jgi:predicted MarR family transcription regulator